MGFMATLLLFWLGASFGLQRRSGSELTLLDPPVPVSALATLLSYDELSRLFPSLTKVLDKSPPLRAFVQNSLPSMALIGFNALLPSALEVLCYAQGLQARSWIEHSLLKKYVHSSLSRSAVIHLADLLPNCRYFLFLLISVVFVWNITTTYWALVRLFPDAYPSCLASNLTRHSSTLQFRDLADSPLKIPEKLAQSLSAGPAKHFFLSYVILQGAYSRSCCIHGRQADNSMFHRVRNHAVSTPQHRYHHQFGSQTTDVDDYPQRCASRSSAS